MQTFLPYSDFRRTAAVLDLRRLGKQRVETLQILRALTFDDYGWRNHPAVTMWAGSTEALVTYGVTVTRRWQAAGFADTVGPQLVEFLGRQPLRSQRELRDAGLLPAWLGLRPLHRSHQAALLRKDPGHYGPLFPKVDPDLPYVWPDAPPPQRDDEPVSGWVVRVAPHEVPALLESGFVGIRPLGDESPDLPAGAGTRNTKRRRQITSFFEAINAGDRVVVPDAATLHVGAVEGDYSWSPEAPFDLRHTRRVRWITAVHRAGLRRPVHLQDPRIVFPLRGEPVLGEAGSSSSGPARPGRATRRSPCRATR